MPTARTSSTRRRVGLVLPPPASLIGQGWTFWIFAVTGFGWVFVGRFVPGTEGRDFAALQSRVCRSSSSTGEDGNE
ncbi:hypothetical protein [Actinomadura algeriensis]|uniref:Uncharacterized protein n=1 Tax=Actinomadura algeriensis TaxID=1679523 RepID=A0ABR9K1Z9_9ACTN|nr:hypothetical protein [Actinomadura algeriensis]MBE1536884.1 hypothetical protein [Actinomadura algeriensis]